MSPYTLILFIFIGFFGASSVQAELTPVRLILKWDHQFQFAGYYAAQWQGFYAEEGLDVSFTTRPQKDAGLLDLNEELEFGRADFAVGGPTILQHISDGGEYVLLSSVFQRSPFSFVVLKDSPIQSLVDLYSDCIETSNDFGELELKSVLIKEGMPLEKIKWAPFSFGLAGIRSGKCSVVIDYSISAKWAAKEKNIRIREFNSEQFGVNFYGDVLYTKKSLIDQDPLMVEKFRRASMKGWRYALENPEAVSKTIEEKLVRVYPYDDNYAYNMMSSHEIKKLMAYPVVEIGHTNIDRWKKIQAYLYSIGAVSSDVLPEWFVFDYSKYKNNSMSYYMVYIFLVLLLILIYGFFYVSKKYEKEVLKKQNRALLDSHELLIAVLDLLPMSIFWKDNQSRYLGSNKAFLEDAGLHQDADIIGKTDLDMPWKEQAKNFVKDDQSVLSGEKTTEPYEEIQEREDGSVEWLRTRKTPILNKNHEVVGVLGAYQSITEYKLALLRLDEEKTVGENLLSRLKGVIRSSPDMIFYKDFTSPDGQYLLCNELFEDWVGRPETEILGKTDGELFDPEMSKEFNIDDDAVIDARSSIQKELNVKTASGKNILYELTRVPVYSKSGDINGVLGIGKDITEKRELESLYEVLFTATNDAYFILSEDGVISNCNDKALEYLAIEHKASLIGLRLIRDFTPKYQPDGTLSIERAQESNKQLMQSENDYYSVEFVHQNINQDLLYVDVFLAKIGNGHTLVQWHDISESQERQRQLELAKKEAEELAKTKSLFLANMSHEIRTPLNAIVGLGGLLTKTQDAEKLKLYIAKITDSSQHLLNVVNDILDYSKLDANKMEVEQTRVDFYQLLRKVVSMYEKQAMDSLVSLEIRLPDSCFNFNSDPVKLTQIFSNILSNAIKFCENGKVIIGADVFDREVHVWIEDNGVGIAQDQIGKLFNPFTQEDETTTRKYGGTGLGLSICKALVELLGGSIRVESEVNRGTKFTVALPLMPDNGTVKEVVGDEIPELSSFSILVAEDNVLNQLVIEELLNETGVNVIIVSNGEEALSSIKNNDYDLVLMDIQMPVMDGLQATRRVRESLMSRIPIVALTANAGEEEKSKALEAGMNDFMTKPIDQKALFKMLKKWLQ